MRAPQAKKRLQEALRYKLRRAAKAVVVVNALLWARGKPPMQGSWAQPALGPDPNAGAAGRDQAGGMLRGIGSSLGAELPGGGAASNGQLWQAPPLLGAEAPRGPATLLQQLCALRARLMALDCAAVEAMTAAGREPEQPEQRRPRPELEGALATVSAALGALLPAARSSSSQQHAPPPPPLRSASETGWVGGAPNNAESGVMARLPANGDEALAQAGPLGGNYGGTFDGGTVLGPPARRGSAAVGRLLPPPPRRPSVDISVPLHGGCGTAPISGLL